MSTKRKRGGGGGELKEEDPLELKLYRDPWVVKKRLNASDLGHLSRVILPGVQVEKHVLPSLTAEELEKMSGPGLKLDVFDLDTWTQHSLSFKKWQSNGSYKLGLNWVSEFVERRQLRVGDEIGMFWVDSIRGFYFSVTGRAAPPLPLQFALPLPLPLALPDAAVAVPEVEVGEAASPPLHPNPSLCECARKCLHLCPPVLQDFM